MLKVDLIAVGRRPPSWITQAIYHYSRRMEHECTLQILEVKTADRKKKNSIIACQKDEAKLLSRFLNPEARKVAMDSRGIIWSTKQLSEKVSVWSQDTNHFQFLIGGPDGLALDLLNKADEIWSLSNLTFPHLIVRLLVVEQCYRALMINANRAYHR